MSKSNQTVSENKSQQVKVKGQESYLQKEVVELEMKVMGLCHQQLPQLCLLLLLL